MSKKIVVGPVTVEQVQIEGQLTTLRDLPDFSVVSTDAKTGLIVREFYKTSVDTDQLKKYEDGALVNLICEELAGENDCDNHSGGGGFFPNGQRRRGNFRPTSHNPQLTRVALSNDSVLNLQGNGNFSGGLAIGRGAMVSFGQHGWSPRADLITGTVRRGAHASSFAFEVYSGFDNALLPPAHVIEKELEALFIDTFGVDEFTFKISAK